MLQFSAAIREGIDQIFRNAAADGRRMLYEHEVYGVLRLLDLAVPEFILIEHVAELTEEQLKPFGREVVVKIVSPWIAHKQKVGGVKVVSNTGALFIQFVMTRMKEEVLGHFPATDPPVIKGFLIEEYIDFSQALGYETLIGIKEDPAFGPVLTLSRGGDDAEFFARYYDPANSFLPPLDSVTALRMLQTLHIRHKFEAIGHPEYLDYMARAVVNLSALATAYSRVDTATPQYIIETFEVNPFVITRDHRLVALDGYAQFEPASGVDDRVTGLALTNLDSFSTPRGIAVVGVSADPSKYSLGREIAMLLHDLNRTDLFLVNPKGGSLELNGTTFPLYESPALLPQPVDLMVYTAPAQYMLDFIRQLADEPDTRRPRGLIMIPGIPADLDYAAFAQRLATLVPAGLRIIGPNCMGVYFAPDQSNPGVNTLFIREQRLELKSSQFSNTVLLTQSGAFSVTAIDKLRNARVFQAIVSFGNKFDVKITDLMSYFAASPRIDVIALYIEGLDRGEGRRFFELAGTIPKPIIVYKAGRTLAGARAAASHTASMTGSYEVFGAACRQAGVILAENLEDHYNYIRTFSLLSRRPPRGNRVAGVVNAGFESTVGADELKNLAQAKLGPETVVRLNRINRFGLVDTTAPFLDITPMADDRMYAEFVEAILEDANVDCVFVAIVPHTPSLKTGPEVCHDPDGLAWQLVELYRKYPKPLVVSVNAGRYYQEFVSVMEENGIPVFTDIRSTINSLDQFVRYHVKGKNLNLGEEK